MEEISIIICSRESNIRDQLEANIKETIGIKYELIVIDNSENRYSIFEAYNLGISKAKCPYLLLVHEDVLFHTNNWGNILVSTFSDNPKVGLIGVAGGKYKSKMPSAWWDGPENAINIIQHEKNKEVKKWNSGFSNEMFTEVVAIDGVFMVMRKDSRIHFNSKMSGFHSYDLNISFEYIKYGYKIIVTNEILIEHFSPGKIDRSWIESTLKLHEIYDKSLPFYTTKSLSNNFIQSIEFKIGVRFINKLLNEGYKKEALKYWFRLIVIKPYSKFHLRFIKKIY